MESQNILRKYIESILKLQEENKNSPLSLDELNRLHQDLGLSREDLNFIDKKFQDNFQRGLGFIRYQDWNRAIDELEQAVILKPLHIELLYRLAEAYHGRSVKLRSFKDKQKALYYAERCLQSDSKNERALYLIAQLRRNVHSKKRQQGYIKLLMLAIGGLILTLGGYLIWNEYHKNSVITPSPTQEASQDYIPPSPIPVSIQSGPRADGFELVLESSFFELQTEKKFYQIRASLINTKYDISFLEINIRLKNKIGETIKEENITLLSENDLELLAGDALPFSHILSLDSNPVQMSSVDIVVRNLSRVSPKNEAEDAKRINLGFSPEELWEKRIIIKERYQTITAHPDDFEQEIVLQFTNYGKDHIYHLGAEIQWFDLNERQIFSKSVDLVASGETVFAPGQRRRVRVIQQIPLKLDDFKNYKVIINSVK